MTGKGFARRITLANLEKFKPLLRNAKSTNNDTSAADEKPAPAVNPEAAKAEALFSGNRLKIKAPFAPPRRTPRTTPAKKSAGSPPSPIASATPAASPTVRGPVLWKKRLAASDVQRQPGHPTGGVRLTQARFFASGHVIDQTTYFRTIFAGFAWHQARVRPKVDEATVPFEVVVSGASLGVHDLVISHKPTGEAGQGNYTTILKWSSLGPTIRKMNLEGRTLTLFGPKPGATQPYLIDNFIACSFVFAFVDFCRTTLPPQSQAIPSTQQSVTIAARNPKRSQELVILCK